MTKLNFKRNAEGVYALPRSTGQVIRQVGVKAAKTSAKSAFALGVLGMIGITAVTPEDRAPEVIGKVSALLNDVMHGGSGASLAHAAVGTQVTTIGEQGALTQLVKSSQIEKDEGRIEPIGKSNDKPNVTVDQKNGVTTIRENSGVVPAPAPKPENF